MGTENDHPQKIESVLREVLVRHLPRNQPPVASRDTSMNEVIRRMQEKNDGAILIVEKDGKLAGIFTERDYLDKFALEGVRSRTGVTMDTPVEKLMTPSPRTLSVDSTLLDAIQLMTGGGYRQIPIVEASGQVFGLVAAIDAVHYIAEHFPAEVYNLPPRLHQDQAIQTQEGG